MSSRPNGVGKPNGNPVSADDIVIAEETPTLKSVAIGSRPLELPSASLPTLAKPGIGLRSVRQGSTKRSSFSIEKEWTANLSPSFWDVNGGMLEVVPAGFPLERTHREIAEDVSVISSRISDALRKLSIEAEYNNEAAKAKCKTNDCVQFRIRLFSGHETGQPVIVELQRRHGSASSFLSTCRAVLNAAEGRDPCDSQKKTPAFAKKLPCHMKCLQSVKQGRADVKGSLESASEMIRSDHRDCKELGLESLCCLVDPVKSAPSAALEASKLLFVSDELREEIRLLTERDSFSPEEVVLAKHAERLRHLSLCCFSKALNTCCGEKFLQQATKEHRWFCDSFLPCLLDELGRAEAQASNAYHAACCLQVLLRCSPFFREQVSSYGGVPIIERAKVVGEDSFELLELEAGRCLDALGSA